MNHYQHICLSLFLLIGCHFANGQEVSPFPCQEFLEIETTGPDFDTVIYYPNGQVKAEGISFDTYNSIWSNEFDKLPNKKRIWKEYYENGNLKFAYKYPPKEGSILDYLGIHFGNGRFSEIERDFPIAYFYREDGSIIGKGGLHFMNRRKYYTLLQEDFWFYYNKSGKLVREVLYNIDRTESFLPNEANLYPIEIPISYKKKIQYPNDEGEVRIHLTAKVWERHYDNSGDIIEFRFADTGKNFMFYEVITEIYEDLLTNPVDVELAFKLGDEVEKFEYLKLSDGDGLNLSSDFVDSLYCFTTDQFSKDCIDEKSAPLKRRFVKCNKCPDFPEKFDQLFLRTFEIWFENDEVTQAYGYVKDCVGGEYYENIVVWGSYCKTECSATKYLDRLLRSDVTLEMQQLFKENDMNQLYKGIDKFMEALIPKKYHARYKLNRMNR